MPSEKTPPAVHELHDHNVYFLEDVEKIFRLPRSGIAREIRLGRLRVSRRGGRYVFLGIWLRQWLEGGELHREPAHRNGDVHTGQGVSH
jgi:hypothetical protein